MGTPEEKTLTLCHPILVTIVQLAPSTIADNLVPLEILTPGDTQYIANSHHEDAEKARRLLSTVLTQTQINPKVFYKFLQALKDAGEWTKGAVIKLEETIASLQSPPTRDELERGEHGIGASVLTHQPNFPSSHNNYTAGQTMQAATPKQATHSTSSAMSQDLKSFCLRHGLTSDDIEKEVNDKHIQDIYPQMEKWEQVAFQLGLKTPDIRAIEHRAGRDVELMRMYVLQEWKNKKKLLGEATYQVLLEALLKCVCSDSVLQIRDLLVKK